MKKSKNSLISSHILLITSPLCLLLGVIGFQTLEKQGCFQIDISQQPQIRVEIKAGFCHIKNNEHNSLSHLPKRGFGGNFPPSL